MSSPVGVKSSGVLSFSLDDIIKAVLNADGSVSRVYEYDDGGWELEDLDDERVATSEGDSVLITRYDDGQTDRVEIYSPADFLFVDPDPSVPGVILFRSARVRFDGGDDNDDFEGSDEDDDFDCGDGDDRVFGYDGDDAIVGGRGHDDLYGDGGDDSIYGDLGDDSLSGGSNDDMLEGGFGDDRLIGDVGKDQMRGGRDRDLFVFNESADSLAGKRRDVMIDFRWRKDQLDLKSIDAIPGGGDSAFAFLGSNPFSGVAGELRYQDGILSADLDGDRRADFQVQLLGQPVLKATSLIL